MNVRPDLEQTLVPFFDFDAYTRSLLLLARHRVLNEAGAQRLQKKFPLSDGVLGTLTNARIGNATKIRAADLKSNELLGFAKAAAELVTSDSDWEVGLRELGFNWNVKTEKLERPEETSSAAAILLMTIALLGRMEAVNYHTLSDQSSVPVESDVAAQASDWRKNRTPEHIWRQLEWAEVMASRLWLNPTETVAKSSRDSLRVGHLFSAVAIIARPLVR